MLVVLGTMWASLPGTGNHHFGFPIHFNSSGWVGRIGNWLSCIFIALLVSCKVTSQDKAPSVISRVLKKNNRDSAVASEFELVQLLPGERGEQPGEDRVEGVFLPGLGEQ